MDTTRSDVTYVHEMLHAVIEAGATTLNLADTVGYSTPAEFAALVRGVRENVPGAKNVVISTHTHDDLGLGVANALAGVAAGARQVECTINGIGERAGNAALEEVVMAIKVRQDHYPYTTGINSKLLSPISRKLSHVTGSVIQRNKAVVGQNAFAHESGIHQDGMLKNRSTYEIMRPEDVGISGTELVLGKHSGRHALRQRVTELGLPPLRRAVEPRLRRLQDPGRPQKRGLRRGRRGPRREPDLGRECEEVDATSLHLQRRHRHHPQRRGLPVAQRRPDRPRRPRSATARSTPCSRPSTASPASRSS